jgi:hypothetical protein
MPVFEACFLDLLLEGFWYDWPVAGGAVGVSIGYLNNIERPEGINFDYLTFQRTKVLAVG